MKGLLIVIVLVCAAGLYCASVALYAFVLMRRRPLARLYAERAAQEDFCPLAELPDELVLDILLAEDADFYEHPGVIWSAVREAAWTNLRAGRILWGGSTITQQLVKNLYFRFRHSLARKAAELIITRAAERKLGKDKILELYLNIIYFGNGIYGIADAARFYFGKEVRSLTENQMLLLAFIPKAPTVGNPVQHPDVFERCRDRRLDALVRQKRMPAEKADGFRVWKADCLDPELRKNDEYTRNYPQDVVLVNERFGPNPTIPGGYEPW